MIIALYLSLRHGLEHHLFELRLAEGRDLDKPHDDFPMMSLEDHRWPESCLFILAIPDFLSHWP